LCELTNLTAFSLVLMHSGYMAPEYLHKGLISTKSDMFSLGVIIIELLVGSRGYPQNIEESSGDIIENVRLISSAWQYHF
jgi:serine/threonine protein kinase